MMKLHGDKLRDEIHGHPTFNLLVGARPRRRRAPASRFVFRRATLSYYDAIPCNVGGG
jgi:hypothetical protein